MFKILFILFGILILLNITYETSLHRSSKLTNSTIKTNLKNSSNDVQYDDYYDHYDYYISNAYRHKMKINFVFFLMIFCFLNK